MRVSFYKKRQQKKFINRILLKISVKEAARMCNLSERTIRDWRRGKFLMNYEALKILCNKARLPLPCAIKLKKPYWYVYKGSKIGGKLGALACFKKYGSYGGNPEYRKKNGMSGGSVKENIRKEKYFAVKKLKSLDILRSLLSLLVLSWVMEALRNIK